MDKRISSETSKPVQANQPATQKPKVSPMKLLGIVTGAKATAEKAGENVQKSVKRLSSMLEETGKAAGAEGLAPPKLPGKAEEPKKKGLFETVLDQGREANMEADRQRWDAVAKAQPETLSGEKFDPVADTTALYEAGKSKLGTDEKAIRELFWDRTPEQIKAIEATYKDRFKRDLLDDLGKEFEDKNDLKVIEALRKGDRVAAASAALVDATTNLKSKQRVEDVLSRLEPEELKKLESQYQKDHPKRKELREVLGSQFKKERKTEVMALLDGDKQKARVADLQRDFRKDNDKDIVAKLREMDPDQAEEFVKAFNAEAKPGQDIESLIKKKLSGTDEAQALALIKGNRAAADAALIQDGVDGLGSNKKKVLDGLGSHIKDPAERKAYLAKVEKEYNAMYGPDSPKKGKSFRQRLGKELGGETKQTAMALIDQGEVADDKKLQFALSGSKKDGLEVAALVKEHGPEKARVMYKEATGRDLDKDVAARLGGRDRFEAQMALKGEPKTPEEKIARARERAQFEAPKTGFRPGDIGQALVPGLGARKMNEGMQELSTVFTDADERMWANVERAEAALEQLNKAKASGDQAQIEHWTRRVDELTGYAKADTEVVRGEKDGAVEYTAMAATAAATCVVVAASGGTASPLVMAAVGASTNVGVRVSMQGQAYDRNDLGRDAAFGAAEGLGAGLGAVGGKKMGQAVGKAIQGRMKDGMGSRLVRGVSEGVTDGTIGGGVSGLGDQATREDLLDEGLGQAALKLGGGTAEGMRNGAVIGGSIGAAAEIGGTTYSKVRGTHKKAAPEPELNAQSSRPDPELPEAATRPEASSRETSGAGSQSGEPKTWSGIDEILEAAKTVPRKDPVGMGTPDHQLDLDVKELKGRLEAEVARRTEQNPRYGQIEAEVSVLNEEAFELLRRAADDGRIDGSLVFNSEVRKATAWRILKEMKARGVRFDTLTQNGLSPFKQKATKRTKEMPRPKRQEEGNYTKTLDSECQDPLAVADARQTAQKALEKAPPVLKTSVGEVKVYGAQGRSLDVYKQAIEDMEDAGPELIPYFKSLHTENVLEGANLLRVVGKDGKAEAIGAGGVKGYTVGARGVANPEGDIVVQRSSAGDAHRARMAQRANDRSWGGEKLEEYRTVNANKRGTVVHEVAHLADRARGPAPGTNYSQQPGKPYSLGTERSDFVSDYAFSESKNPGTAQTEDFAETVRFVVQLKRLETPDTLGGGPISPALREKLLDAAEFIGADPKVFEQRLPGWNATNPQ